MIEALHEITCVFASENVINLYKDNSRFVVFLPCSYVSNCMNIGHLIIDRLLLEQLASALTYEQGRWLTC